MLEADCAVSVYGAVEAKPAERAHSRDDSQSVNVCSSRRTTFLLGFACVACCMLLAVTFQWVGYLSALFCSEKCSDIGIP